METKWLNIYRMKLKRVNKFTEKMQIYYMNMPSSAFYMKVFSLKKFLEQIFSQLDQFLFFYFSKIQKHVFIKKIKQLNSGIERKI